MKSETKYRINGFKQEKAFWSWVFNNADKRITSQHVSIYLFFVYQNNRNNWVEWFKCPYDLGMTGACIGNKKTYYACLNDLVDWKLIQYKKGTNEWRAPLIKLEVLNCNSTYTASVPVPTPLPTPLPTTLPTHIYKLLTNNLKRITDNLPEVVKFLDEIEKRKTRVLDYSKIVEAYRRYCPELRKVSKLSDERKKHITARYQEFNYETIEEVLKKAGESEFLAGKNARVWKADIDWIFNPTNFLKILEGKYDNKVNGSSSKLITGSIKTTPIDEIR